MSDMNEGIDIDINLNAMIERVSQPGMYEACPPWVPYFHDLILEGEGEDYFMDEPNTDWATVFQATTEEMDAFEGYGIHEWVAVISRDDGSVYGLTENSRYDIEKAIELTLNQMVY